MDADQVVEVLLRRSEGDHSGKTLSHFSGVGSEVMEADDPFVFLFDDQFHVARVLWLVSDGPLEGPEVCVEDFDVFFAVPCGGIFLGKSAAAVLDRREDCGGDVVVVRQDVRLAAKATSKEFTGLS